jgi:hypothetical protein
MNQLFDTGGVQAAVVAVGPERGYGNTCCRGVSSSVPLTLTTLCKVLPEFLRVNYLIIKGPNCLGD